MTRECRRCGATKPLDEFQKIKSGKDGRGYLCKPCNVDYCTERKEKHRLALAQYKTERGCERCGYDTHDVALHFDHIDRATKSFMIAQNTGRSWKKLMEEVAKCRVLCANCHAIKTYECGDTV